ncbi:hypothetical protein QQP08_020804 [Theobroma cacao]|nr:hypothetical protein QQP08_020804 [Theobroma cacao]
MGRLVALLEVKKKEEAGLEEADAKPKWVQQNSTAGGSSPWLMRNVANPRPRPVMLLTAACVGLDVPLLGNAAGGSAPIPTLVPLTAVDVVTDALGESDACMGCVAMQSLHHHGHRHDHSLLTLLVLRDQPGHHPDRPP